MSGIAVIFGRDERPVEPGLMDTLLSAIAHRGPDGSNSWSSGPVALGHAMLHTTPESILEIQPFKDEAANLCLVLDGRIDNRAELAAALRGNGVELRSDTDSELLLRAYQCWGEESPRRIIGDFAFALWDARKRQLFCARDVLGLRPFYYISGKRGVVCGSELQQVLRCGWAQREPNEGFIGEYLWGGLANRRETPFRNVFRLEPAHLLIAGPQGVVTRRYYDLNPAIAVRYSSDQEYADHFHDTFKEAVRCRMRSVGGCAAELSGGLDSSSVVGMAQSLLRSGEIPQAPFETFSLLYTDPKCDERSYIRDVVSLWGLKSSTAEASELELPAFRGKSCRYKDFAGYPDNVRYEALRGLVRENGYRVLLTGASGDDWFTGSPYYYADLIHELRFAELFRQLSGGSQTVGIDRSFGALLRFGILPLLPEPLRRLASKLSPRAKTAHDWLGPDLVRRTRLYERLAEARANPMPQMAPSQREIYDIFSSGWVAHMLELEDRSAAAVGIEPRSPFHDRRLIEFAFAIPENQRQRGAQTKYVLRRGMGALLPESVRTRTGKGDFSGDERRTNAFLARTGVLDSLKTASLGWVRADRLCAILRDCQDSGRLANPWPLWRTFNLELWLTAAFEELPPPGVVPV